MSESTCNEAYESVRAEIESLFQQLLLAANSEVIHWNREVERNTELMEVLSPMRRTEMKLESEAVWLVQQLECAKTRQSKLVERQSRVLAGLSVLRLGDSSKLS